MTEAEESHYENFKILKQAQIAYEAISATGMDHYIDAPPGVHRTKAGGGLRVQPAVECQKNLVGNVLGKSAFNTSLIIRWKGPVAQVII